LLRRSYRTVDYLEATRGFQVQAIYMEVDLDPARHRAEVEHVVRLSRSADHPTVAAVVGGRPAAPEFTEYVTWLAEKPEVKGVRQVLHGAGTKPGYCLQEDFVRGIRALGEQGLRFDLCLRPAELGDGLKLTQKCPDTQFIIDHCGNADPKAFQKDSGGQPTWHQAARWRRDMAALAKRSNVVCKISGIVARAPRDGNSEHLAPIVNHCLDTFGPDRVVFGGDWPVCLKGAPLREWIKALGEIIAERPADQQTKIWHANAQRIYALTA
jgi:L-fuconolactonase